MNQNNFGPLSTEYKNARRGYSSEVYAYLLAQSGLTKPETLDIGCGTGISSRELSNAGFRVTGVDIDPAMLNLAQKEDSDITYMLAPAHNLPFTDNQFDIVTAFTAFHWFNTEEALSEIKRVLKPGGIFFAALKGNKNGGVRDEFREGYIAILKKYAGSDFDKTKLHFDHTHLTNIFGPCTERDFTIDEHYTVEESLALLRSLSSWNLVPDEKKSDLQNEMRHHFENNLTNGKVVRRRQIFTLFVRK